MTDNQGWWPTQETTTPVQDAQVVEPGGAPPSNMATPVEGFKGLPVRAGGDRVWILKEGKKFWIRSAEAFANLGFKFGDEKEIDRATLDVLPEGEPIG